MQSSSSLPPAHLATAVRMFTDLQRDPSGTLKKLLAEAVALGHTVEGIGQGVDVAGDYRCNYDPNLLRKKLQRNQQKKKLIADCN
jgi:hypothetical protein